MKTPFSIPSAFICLLLVALVSCKKEEPVTPGPSTPGTTTKSSAKEIKTFVFAALSPVVSAAIDASAKTITATVPASTDLTKLVPTITVSDKATVSPASGIAQDFSKAITYTVTAEDGSTQAYTATVTKAPSVASICRVVAVVGTSTSGDSKYTYQVDAQSRLIQSKFESYDKSGTLLSTQTTPYPYDASGFLSNQITTYTYSTSNKFNIKERGSVYTYQNGRLVKDVFTLAYVDPTAGGSSSTFQYEYDAQGNLSKRINTLADGTIETTTFANGIVATIGNNKGATYQLNAQGFVTKKTNADGSYTLNQYNTAGQQTRIENYNAQGVKISYTTNDYSSTIINTPPTNPVALKGHPVVIPSAFGATGRLVKTASYTIDASGKETKNSETSYTYQVDSKGNLASYVYTSSFLSGTTTITSTSTSTYEYQGCQ